MRRRQGFSVVVTLMSLMMAFGGYTDLIAANCRATQSGDAIRTGGYVGSDGKVHYRIGYGPGVGSAHIAAMQHAINLWNAHSNATNIVLEEHVTSGTPDFELKKNSSMNPGACAEYVPGGSYIWYSEVWMAWVVNHPEIGGRAYAHELGHALGLTHKGAGSIMQEPPRGVQTCLDGANMYLPDHVTEDDAADARDCSFDAHEPRPFGPPPSYLWEERWAGCRTIYLRESFYSCPDGVCYLQYVIDTPWYTDCE